MTTADYLESLQDDLSRTVEALSLEEGTNFTDIADMAENGDIGTGGGGSSEYFDENAMYETTPSNVVSLPTAPPLPAWLSSIKKVPKLYRAGGRTAKLLFALMPTETIDLTGVERITTSCSYMFSCCFNVKNLDLSTIPQIDVTNTSSMFLNCRSLLSINLSPHAFSRVTDASYMFSGCSSLNLLDIRSFDFSKVSTSTNMFGATTTGNASNVPDNCLIIVKDATAKSWITSKFSRLTNVKTVAEYEAL